VTDTALQRGAWRSADGNLALIFVNVTDQPLSAVLKFDGTVYGFGEGDTLSVTPRTEDGPGQPVTKPCVFEQSIELEPYAALAYEIAPAPGG